MEEECVYILLQDSPDEESWQKLLTFLKTASQREISKFYTTVVRELAEHPPPIASSNISRDQWWKICMDDIKHKYTRARADAGLDQQPMAPQAVSAPQQPSDTDTIREIRKLFKNFQLQLADFKHGPHHVEQELLQLRQEQEERTRENSRVIDDLKNQLKEYMRQCEALKNTNQQLDNEIGEVKKLNEMLHQQNTRLQEQLDQQSNEIRQQQMAVQQSAEISMQEQSEANQKVDQMKQAMEQLRLKITELEGALEDKNMQLASVNKEKTTMEELHETMKRELELLQKQLTDLTKSSAESSTAGAIKVEELKGINEEKDKLILDLTRDVHDKQQRLEDLHKQITNLTENHALQLSQLNEELLQAKTSLSEQTALVADLREQIKALKANTDDEKQAFLDKLTSMEKAEKDQHFAADNEKLLQQLDELRAHIENKEKEIEILKTAHQDENQSLTSEITRLGETLRIKEEEINMNKENIKQLTRKNSEFQRQITTMEEELGRQHDEIMSYMSQSKKMSDQILQYETVHADFQQRLKAKEQLESENQRLTTENESLVKKLRDAESEADSKNSQSDLFFRQVQELQAELTNARKSAEASQQLLQTSQAQWKDELKQSENRRAQNALESAELQGRLQAQIETLNSEIAQLREELSKKTAINQESILALGTKQAEIAKLTEENQKLHQQTDQCLKDRNTQLVQQLEAQNDEMKRQESILGAEFGLTFERTQEEWWKPVWPLEHQKDPIFEKVIPFKILGNGNKFCKILFNSDYKKLNGSNYVPTLTQSTNSSRTPDTTDYDLILEELRKFVTHTGTQALLWNTFYERLKSDKYVQHTTAAARTYEDPTKADQWFYKQGESGSLWVGMSILKFVSDWLGGNHNISTLSDYQSEMSGIASAINTFQIIPAEVLMLVLTRAALRTDIVWVWDYKKVSHDNKFYFSGLCNGCFHLSKVCYQAIQVVHNPQAGRGTQVVHNPQAGRGTAGRGTSGAGRGAAAGRGTAGRGAAGQFSSEDFFKQFNFL
jgi:chromosome segregation ATPase